jgi:hypothetical protein
MPFLAQVRASPESRPKPIKLRGAEEHAVFVLTRNLARENPLSTSACPARKTVSQNSNVSTKVEHAASFPPQPPATDLISKPHAPDHKPHPNDPGDRENFFSTVTMAKKIWSWYLQKCRWTFLHGFHSLDRFLLRIRLPSASSPKSPLLVLYLFEQTEGVSPRVDSANRAVLTVIAGGRSASAIGRNRGPTRKDFGTHLFQIGFHRVE